MLPDAERVLRHIAAQRLDARCRGGCWRSRIAGSGRDCPAAGKRRLRRSAGADRPFDSSAPVLVVTSPSTTCLSAGTWPSGSKPPARSLSYSRNRASTPSDGKSSGLGHANAKRYRSGLKQLGFPAGSRATPYPQTSRATSTIRPSFAHCCPTLSALPWWVLEKPHCGLQDCPAAGKRRLRRSAGADRPLIRARRSWWSPAPARHACRRAHGRAVRSRRRGRYRIPGTGRRRPVMGTGR